jgi:hypothetical protein
MAKFVPFDAAEITPQVPGSIPFLRHRAMVLVMAALLAVETCYT